MTIRSVSDEQESMFGSSTQEKGQLRCIPYPGGVEDYSYIKDRKEIKGIQYKVKLEFPKKKK